jgi:cyclophilin family peptidyl-prolyl cis-trans isomerase
LSSLDIETREIFKEAFSSDPTWNSQGTVRLHPPDALIKGYLEIELDYKSAPKAAENFRCLCTGEKGKGKASGKTLHYKGLDLHRIVTGFVAQGGDVVKNDGSGGDSIYNGAFKDEKTALALKNDHSGIVGMANSGPHTNKSQFYITLAPAPQCDGKHVVLGKVVNSEGLEFLKKIDEMASSESGSPRAKVLIADCGEVQ